MMVALNNPRSLYQRDLLRPTKMFGSQSLSANGLSGAFSGHRAKARCVQPEYFQDDISRESFSQVGLGQRQWHIRTTTTLITLAEHAVYDSGRDCDVAIANSDFLFGCRLKSYWAKKLRLLTADVFGVDIGVS
tara:strand:- start:1137 stop:1535 length:399 start_codon:yes stop_codon:yes gene_type:complete